jgi:hypothetical protein
MKDSELHNFFKVADSRNISTVELAEILILNGRQIYLYFLKEQFGTILYEGLNKVEKPITYRIESSKGYPITPDSRIDLIDSLKKKKDKSELKIRIEWEDTENNNYGSLIIKVAVNLISNLVIDYEDFKFLPPLSNIKGGHTVPDGTSSPKFFGDNYFHKLVLRTMRKEGTNWNMVKRNLSKHTLQGEKIKIIEVTNHEGDMRPQIQFSTSDSIEPYKVMESTFRKKLTSYRKHLKKLPLPGNV